MQRAVQRRIAVPLSKLMLRHRLDAVRPATAVCLRATMLVDVRFVGGLRRLGWRRIRTRRRCATPPTTPPRSLCSCSA